MEIEKVVKELTLEDLRKTTWDYSKIDFLGLYEDDPIMTYLFEAVNCNVDRNLLTVQKCNVEEGWIEFIEVEGDPIVMNGKVILPGQPKIEDDCIVRTKVYCNMLVHILDAKGNVLVTLS